MTPALIIIVGVIYLYISVESFYMGSPGLGVAYFGYAVGNVGLYMMAIKSIQH